jgi:hypothetical protein
MEKDEMERGPSGLEEPLRREPVEAELSSWTVRASSLSVKLSLTAVIEVERRTVLLE